MDIPRDLDMAVSCFIRSFELRNPKAIHYLHRINRNNEAVGNDREKIKEILRKNNPYNKTVEMLGAQARMDLQEFFLQDKVGSSFWQQTLDRLQLAAEKKDVRSQWELALQYMVGRGCEQNCDLAKKYAEEAIKQYPLLRCFISENLWQYSIPSLHEVLDDPDLILAHPTAQDFKRVPLDYRKIGSRLMIFYPELVLKRLCKVRYCEKEEFLAIWPVLYPFLEWKQIKNIPDRLLSHQPQLAEVLPVIWSATTKRNIFLIHKHQKFERYIKAEQFDKNAFAEILPYRPEYIRLMDVQNFTGAEAVEILNKKIELHKPPVLSPEERLLESIFGEDQGRKKKYIVPVTDWMESISHFSGDPRFFQDRIGYREANILHSVYAYNICLDQNIPCALEIRDLNEGRVSPPYSSHLLANPFAKSELLPEIREKLFSLDGVTPDPSPISPVFALYILENKVEEFQNYQWKIPQEKFFEKVINMGVPQIRAVNEYFGSFVKFLCDNRSILTEELGKKLYAAGMKKTALQRIYCKQKELLPTEILQELLQNETVFKALDWGYILQKKSELTPDFFKHFGVSDPDWTKLSNEQYEKIISRFPYLYKLYQRELSISCLVKVFLENPELAAEFDFSKLSDDDYRKIISRLPELYQYHRRTLPVPVLMKVFAADETIAEEFDFSSFTAEDWIDSIASGYQWIRDKILEDPARNQMFQACLNFEHLAEIFRKDNWFFFEMELYLHKEWQSSQWGNFPLEALKKLYHHLERQNFPASPSLLDQSVWYSFLLECPAYFYYVPCKFNKSQMNAIFYAAGPVLQDVFEKEFAAGNLYSPHKILLKYPEMINENNKHTLEKVTSSAWCYELRSNAALAKYCLWEKLTKEHWEVLLHAQPQYADKCPMLSTLELSAETWEKIKDLFYK